MSTRLDVFTAKKYGISRSRAQSLIAHGAVTVNGVKARSSHMVSDADIVEAIIPPQNR